MVVLVDNQETGHHKVYQMKLSEIENTCIKNEVVNFQSIRENYFKALKQRKNFLNESRKNIKNDAVIHLVYIDSLYKCPMISKYINKKNNLRYIGTLHWIPEGKLSTRLLKKFCGKLEIVIVHSEYLKKRLNEIGIQNVECVDYPSFISKNNINEERKIKQKIVVSCLGGTRNDKGLDILINSFKYITSEARKKLVINIAGIEQCIKYNDLETEARAQGIELQTKNKFLSDEEYELELYKSDVILLPYKKIFKGNSGPMTDGVYINKYILGPNEGNLGYLIDKHDLGDTFNIEDAVDLAKKLSELVAKDLKKNHRYAKELDVEKFIEKHKEIYKKVIEK